MDRQFLSSLNYSNYKAMFLSMEDALDHIVEVNKWCNKNKSYCEEEIILSNKVIIVNIDVWELPEDNSEN